MCKIYKRKRKKKDSVEPRPIIFDPLEYGGKEEL
jgi:hypothetical protein